MVIVFSGRALLSQIRQKRMVAIQLQKETLRIQTLNKSLLSLSEEKPGFRDGVIGFWENHPLLSIDYQSTSSNNNLLP